MRQNQNDFESYSNSQFSHQQQHPIGISSSIPRFVDERMNPNHMLPSMESMSFESFMAPILLRAFNMLRENQKFIDPYNTEREMQKALQNLKQRRDSLKESYRIRIEEAQLKKQETAQKLQAFKDRISQLKK